MANETLHVAEYHAREAEYWQKTAYNTHLSGYHILARLFEKFAREERDLTDYHTTHFD